MATKVGNWLKNIRYKERIMRRYRIVYVGGVFATLFLLVLCLTGIGIPIALMIVPGFYEIVAIGRDRSLDDGCGT